MGGLNLINIFPMIYPDEVFFSWVGRFSTLSGYLTYDEVVQELFGQRNINNNIYYPEGLDFLCSKLPHSLNLTSEYIIEHHTTFPFFRPFMSEKNQKTVIDGMKIKGKYHLKDIMGVNAGYIFNDNRIKLCSDCFIEDVQNLGEGYIHRIHQIPGNLICLKHSRFLMLIDVSDILVKKNFIDINRITDRFIYNTCTSPSEEHIKLSQDIATLLDNKILHYEQNTVLNKYRNLLSFKNYRSNSGIISQAKITNDFSSYYSKKFLTDLTSNLDKNSYSYKDNWLNIITKGNRQKVHPIRHLLFIRFLFGSFKDFIEFNSIYKPFGDSPWPCLNRAANHYLTRVVDKCEVRIDLRQGNPVGRFKCNCGFEYLRHGPDNCENDRHRYDWVNNYGPVWEAKLRELMIIESYSASKVGRILNCKGDTISHHAAQLGIGNHSRSVKLLRVSKLTRLDQYKNIVAAYIKQNPDVIRKDIYTHFSKECATIIKNDRDWYEINMPPRSNRALNARYEADLQQWHQKDVELNTKVLIIVEQILIEFPPVRVSKTQIIARLNYTSFNPMRNSKKLPITLKTIESSIESLTDFKKRKMEYFAKQMYENNETVTKTSLSEYVQYEKKEKEVLIVFRNKLVEKYNSIMVE
jgi:hypothetical protein